MKDSGPNFSAPLRLDPGPVSTTPVNDIVALRNSELHQIMKAALPVLDVGSFWRTLSAYLSEASTIPKEFVAVLACLAAVYTLFM